MCIEFKTIFMISLSLVIKNRENGSGFKPSKKKYLCVSNYHGILAQKTVGYPHSRDPPDSRIEVPIFCHCQSKGIVNISVTWSSRATMQQSAQSEDDCSLVFLHNLHRTKLIKTAVPLQSLTRWKWHDFEMELNFGIQTFEIKLNVKQMKTLCPP